MIRILKNSANSKTQDNTLYLCNSFKSQVRAEYALQVERVTEVQVWLSSCVVWLWDVTFEEGYTQRELVL